MIVECIKDRLANFEPGPVKDVLRKAIRRDEDLNIGIDIGRQYTVYGIFIDKELSMPFYFICEEDRDAYPLARSAEFFKIIDSKPSSYWRFIYSSKRQGLYFPEWAEDEYFYGNLIDGKKKEEAIFAKYRKLMDEESRVLAGF